MCGRYAISLDPARLAAEFDAVDGAEGAVGPDHNVTPTRLIPIIVERFPVGADSEDRRPAPVRSVRAVRWGLVPPWAPDLTSGPPMINARAETITEKPAYRQAVRRRRCLVPATGWYEWQPNESGKQPFLSVRRDGRPLAMAAVFSTWWPKDQPKENTAPVVSCAVVTTEAQGEFARVHHRMPLVLGREHWEEWLDPGAEEVRHLLDDPAVVPLDELTMYPVSKEVNSMRNNGPRLVDPVELEDREPPSPAPTLFEA
ncbi:SOS response-associated peptidase [Actinoalloteichus caeruleus]|uniref:SOS response-associated peptidase n=1 Tax=Actinoalloteichus cyanogriseus TaxID=2893586 RepID=UPI003AAD0470